MTKIKICGITTEEAALTVRDMRADFAGFVFYKPSPRYVELSDAVKLSALLPKQTKKVALFVDPDDEVLRNIVEGLKPDLIQLHGDESIQRVREIRKTYNIQVIKAVPVFDAEDLKIAAAYERVADWILFDAKSLDELSMPGGMGVAFDWSVLECYKHHKPWILAGGLHAGNVNTAIAQLSPDAVDVSSGVEDWPGLKNPALIEEFIENVRETL